MTGAGRAAAVFDLDGTLVRGTSAERLFLPWLRKRGRIGLRQWAAFLPVALTYPVLGRTVAFRRNKRYLTGFPVELARSEAEKFVAEVLAHRLCAPVVRELEAARSVGKPAFLLSGAPDFLVDAVGRRLGLTASCGTRLEVKGDRLTGRLGGPHWFGAAKADGVEELRRDHGIDLAASSGYADHASDVAFLACFGRAVCVDPGPELARQAAARGWEILRCDAA